MSTDHNYISTGELFSDLQQSMTNIFLMESLTNQDDIENYKDRLEKERQILVNIKKIAKNIFKELDLINYLENGYLRQHKLGLSIEGGL